MDVAAEAPKEGFTAFLRTDTRPSNPLVAWNADSAAARPV